MAKDGTGAPLSSGVDALITRLREEGVSTGQAEGDAIVADARSRAARIIEQANREAADKLEAAQREADAYRAAGEEALKAAMRDAILEMKSGLMQRFSLDVERLVSTQMADATLLRDMILAVAGRARDSGVLPEYGALDIVLPADAVGMDELRNNPDELQHAPLTQFVLGLTGDMLRDGVTLSEDEDFGAGIVVRAREQEVSIELSDESVAGVILKHLQPRFRAILEGIIR